MSNERVVRYLYLEYECYFLERKTFKHLVALNNFKLRSMEIFESYDGEFRVIIKKSKRRNDQSNCYYLVVIVVSRDFTLF